MSADTYNGWANYETWAVKLWLDNDHGTYLYWQEVARETFDEAEDHPTLKTIARPDNARYRLSERLKEEIGDQSPLVGEASLYSDLLSAAISEVNWDEIANALLEDNVEEYETATT